MNPQDKKENTTSHPTDKGGQFTLKQVEMAIRLSRVMTISYTNETYSFNYTSEDIIQSLGKSSPSDKGGVDREDAGRLPSSGWISCSDRLPSNIKSVLVMDKLGQYDIGHYHGDEWSTETPLASNGITHWSPIPPPPHIGLDKEAIDELAKKNIVCWIVPVSYLNPEKVEWGYEIEILPYSEIGRHYHEKDGSNFVYSYQEWSTYEEAKTAMVKRANELFEAFTLIKRGLASQPTAERSVGEVGCIKCPSCGELWNTINHNACKCGASILEPREGENNKPTKQA